MTDRSVLSGDLRALRISKLLINQSPVRSAVLSQIALECGMCDQAHFTRVLRKIAGVNPAAWR